MLIDTLVAKAKEIAANILVNKGEEHLTVENVQHELKKQAGFSLPGILVASVIAAILGAVAISNMWDSVDKSRVSAEVNTVQNLATAVGGLMDEVNGFPAVLDDNADKIINARVSSLPSDFTYLVVLAQNDTATRDDDVIMIKAMPTTAKGVGLLKKLASDMEARIDNDTISDTANKNDADGRFGVAYTCTTDADGKPTQAHTDCFYVYRAVTKKVAPTNLLDMEVDVDNTAAHPIASDLLVTGLSGNVTELTK